MKKGASIDRGYTWGDTWTVWFGESRAHLRLGHLDGAVVLRRGRLPLDLAHVSRLRKVAQICAAATVPFPNNQGVKSRVFPRIGREHANSYATFLIYR